MALEEQINIVVFYCRDGTIDQIRDERLGKYAEKIKSSGSLFEEIMRQDRAFATGADEVVIGDVEGEQYKNFHYRKIRDVSGTLSKGEDGGAGRTLKYVLDKVDDRTPKSISD